MSLKNVASKLKGKNILGNIFEEVSWKDSTGVFEKAFGVKMTKPAKLIGTGLVASYVAGSTLLEENHKDKLGDIEAGQVSNTINHESSHTLKHTSDKLKQDPGLEYRYYDENVDLAQKGADANIVFALHQLRGGE